MRIIISPAKKMKDDLDSLDWKALPAFLGRTEELKTRLQSMSFGELKRLWKCNDQLAELNVQRLQTMDLRRHLTPAILSYEGIQYQYMAPGVFTTWEFAYIQEHLRILSGFYGLLRPFDGVAPYRLEMQARLATDHGKDVYAFWGDSLAKALFAETDCIINLASKEYGKVVEKATMCKMARGEMVRYMAEHGVTRPEELQDFVGRQFRFAPEHSDKDRYVFLRDPRLSKR